MRVPRAVLFQKCREIQTWFGEAGLKPAALEVLKKRTASKVLRDVTYKQFDRYINNPSRRGSANPQTARWIDELHTLITQSDRRAQRDEIERALGVLQIPATPPAVSVARPQDTPLILTSEGSDPQSLCNIAVHKARLGLHVIAWQELTGEFRHYALIDGEFAMHLAPTLIYLGYRYFSIEEIGRAAQLVSDCLEQWGLRCCSDMVRLLCLVQLGTALSEHGEGVYAAEILTRNRIDALLRSNQPFRWPQSQILRTVATQRALHDPDAMEEAIYWVKRSQEHVHDPLLDRSAGSVRYTIHMQASEPLAAWDAIAPFYSQSRDFLIRASTQKRVHFYELLQICNDVYLGAIAQSVSGTYERRRRLDDERLLQWGLQHLVGPTNIAMDDSVMRIPEQKLSCGLRELRLKLIRQPFSANPNSLKAVLRLARTLR